jgi:hypothetical protein
MRVVCIDKLDSIKIGSLYDTVFNANFLSYNYYYILDDNGFYQLYHKSCFITLKEVRRLKLKKLEIDS